MMLIFVNFWSYSGVMADRKRIWQPARGRGTRILTEHLVGGIESA
jgi:hypothetical protein